MSYCGFAPVFSSLELCSLQGSPSRTDEEAAFYSAANLLMSQVMLWLKKDWEP